MKYFTSVAIACCIVGGLAVLVAHRAAAGPTVSIKYPSDMRAKGTRGTTSFSPDFILYPISDLRLLYCDTDTLQARVASGICVVDFDQASPVHKELNVTRDTTLAEVLKASGDPRLKAWRGRGQPAVRVISKRAIMLHDGTAQFLETKIAAGDFVLVLQID
jgi:hypothetical protein